MGKGDKKTKRGKLFMGSFGVTRPKSGVKAGGKTATAPRQPKEKADKEVKKEVKEAKEAVTVKSAKDAAPAKKEMKATKPKTE